MFTFIILDFIEYLASLENLSEVIDVSSSDESDDIQIIKELKTPVAVDHRCDLCCEGEFLIDRTLRFAGLINDKYRFVCDKCDKNFIQKSELNKHYSSCSGPKYDEINIVNGFTTRNKKQSVKNCSVCSKSYKSVSGLKKHMLTKHGETIHECAICHKNFNDHAKFKYHCYLHEKTNVKNTVQKYKKKK